MIPVSKPFMPPLDEVVRHLQRAWDVGVLTNHGPLATELEGALRTRLAAPHLSVVANGTLALHVALRAFDVRGEVITTPMSFAATATSVLWEHCVPVFADVDPGSLNLDPAAARAAMTDETTAILATHVYGNPCDVDAFERLRQETGCVLLYDAAHAFDVRVHGQSVLEYGDASALSFHATKVFHTAEGGAVAVRDPERRARVERLRNFGQSAPGVFTELGTNAKLSELHAALGLAVLAHLDAILDRRRAVAASYDALLGPDSPALRRPTWHPDATRNHAYYPLLLADEGSVLTVLEALKLEGYLARRYFYPALNTLPYVEARACPIAEDAARRAICLPLHTEVSNADVHKIVETVLVGVR